MTMIFLLSICLFHAINNFIVLSRDRLPLLWEMNDLFIFSLRCLEQIQACQVLPLDPSYPPLLFYLTTPLLFIFGRTPDIAAMTNSLFLSILIFATYGIGKEIKNRTCGIMSAFIVSTFPIVFAFSRMYWFPIPVAAMTALSVFILIKTDGFQNRKNSIILGIVLGLAMLTKWTFPAYFLPPFSLYLIWSFKEKSIYKTRTKIINLSIITLITVSIAFIWYRHFFYPILCEKLQIIFNNPFGKNLNLSLLSNLKVYLGCLINYQIHLFYFIMFIPSLILFIIKKSRMKYLILSWLIIPSMLFLLSPPPLGSGLKANRFLIPALPPIGIIISYALCEIKKKGFLRCILCLTIAGGLAQYILLSYFVKHPVNYFPDYFAKSPIAEIYPWQIRVERGILHPYTKNWNTPETAETLLTNSSEYPIHVLILQNVPSVQDALQLKAYQEKLPIIIECPSRHLDGGDPRITYDFPSLIAKADYVLSLGKGYNEFAFNLGPILPLLNEFKKQQKNFRFITKIKLPENLILEVYKRQ